MRSFTLPFILGHFMLMTSCMSEPSLQLRNLVITDKAVEGYLLFNGEWGIYPVSKIKNYDRWTKDPSLQCISLAKPSLALRKRFSELPGIRVRVFGSKITYSSISLGSDNIDQYLNKRYYNGTFVPNYCYRDYIFEASDVEIYK